MNSSNYNYEFRVFVEGKEVKEYNHKNKTYVEGRRNSEYELYFRNKSSEEVLVIFSVDGLSVIDGKPASKNSRGYIVRGWDSVRVPGWTISDNKVAKFQFRPQGDRDNATYVEELKREGFDVDSSNQGVIGCMVFSKKKPPVIHHHHWYNTYTYHDPYAPIYLTGNGITRGFAKGLNDVSYNSGAMESLNARGIGQNSANVYLNNMSYYDPAASAVACSTMDSFQADETSLGTSFGQETSFDTTTATFEKDMIVWTAVINYDTITNLKKMGVVQEKTDVNKAFPGDSYCYVPRNKRSS